MQTERGTWAWRPGSVIAELLYRFANIKRKKIFKSDVLPTSREIHYHGLLDYDFHGFHCPCYDYDAHGDDVDKSKFKCTCTFPIHNHSC